MNLVQEFNDLNKSDLFINLKFMKSGYVYVEKERVQFSTSYNNIEIPGLDTKSLIIDTIKSELNVKIYNKIIKDLFDTEVYDLFDFRGSDLEKEFINKIKDVFYKLNGYKNIVCSSYIASLISEINTYSYNYSYNKTSNQTFNHIYKTGNLFGLYDIWIDPYMKYNDTRICGFNEVYVDISDFKFKDFQNNFPSMDQKMITEINWSFDKHSSKVVYLLSDNSDSLVLSEYKKIERDIKLNKILNE